VQVEPIEVRFKVLKINWLAVVSDIAIRADQAEARLRRRVVLQR